MRVPRQGTADRLREQNVLGRGGEQVLASHNVGDTEVDVVDGAGEVIGGGAVGAKNDEIVDLGVVELDVAAHFVDKGCYAGPRHREPDRCTFTGIDSAFGI